ncbi:MAG: hypothetical protein QF530_10600 [SAR202 cluster bacterium]|jgi:hypothetical protein|nr:hypothetical protein [SAR202 cluster bacterium]
MDYELTSILAQTATGVATLAVAVFLSFQLRLQRAESVISAQGELTSGLANTVSDIYTDHELTDIYLRGISEYGSLNKEDKHRFNIFMWTYFLQIQQLWETGKRAEKVRIYATIMLNTGEGIVDWWDNMGRFVYPSEYVDYLDSLLERRN